MADQRSLTGHPLDGAVPGQYYDPADIARRKEAIATRDRIDTNPNWPKKATGMLSNSYLSDGLSYDYEGLLRNVAMKYGLDAAKGLLQKLPTMSKEQLMAIQAMVSQASREADSMDQRERQAYERAGMEYVGGAYRQKHNGQIP